jgi:hypothetical protein
MSSGSTHQRSIAFVIWCLAGLALVAACSRPVQGAVVTFTDAASFTSGISSNRITFEGFDGNPPGTTSIPVNTQFDVGAFDIFYTNASNTDQPTIAQINAAGDQRLNLQFDSGNGVGSSVAGRVTTSIEFRFDSEIYGFGGDWGLTAGDFDLQDGNMLTITVGGDTISIDALLGDLGGTGLDESGFVGFISDTPFTSFTLTMTPIFAVDSFSFDNAILIGPPVPEPSTLLVAAVFAAGFLGRRRRRRVTTQAGSPSS